MKRYSNEWLRAEIERLQRAIERRSKLLAGKLDVRKHWREGYREKKVREVQGHWVHRIVPIDYQPKRRKRT